MLTVERVMVAYGHRVAVREATFELAPGTMLAVTGPSGAGKSSLLWALAGALVPATGTVSLDGRRVRDRRQAARLGVALVPQGNGLAGILTAYENVLAPQLALGVGIQEAHAATRTALADVGLEESTGHLIEELSGGQQQRVAVARCLAAHPRVILADEPTSELDSMNRERVIALLRAQAEGGTVVVMATHDAAAAAEADAELALDEGVQHWR